MIVEVVLLLILLTYYLYSKKYNYWSKQKVKHDFPIPFIGNIAILKYLFRLKSIVEVLSEICDKYPEEKFIGVYSFSTKLLVLKDPDLINTILTEEFPSFSKRGIGRNPEIESNHKNPVHAEGDLWKLLRQRLTPVFTTAKLKKMFPLIIKCAKNLQNVVEDIALNEGDCQTQRLLTRYILEITGTCGFGINMDTLKNENSPFMKLISDITYPPLWNRFLEAVWDLCPLLRSKIYVAPRAIRDQIANIVQTVMKQRGYKQSEQKDFMDHMINLLNEKIIKGASLEKTNPDGSPAKVEIDVDINSIVAQVYIFFTAGSDTSIIASSSTLYYLAHNPVALKRVHEDIDKVMIKHDNELNYDAVADMTLLKCALLEAMRLKPPVGLLTRICTKRYTFPEHNITIDPGVFVMIPIEKIHNDPKYYVNPEKFDLDRFSQENIQKRQKNSYLTFGCGPRYCIGSRMGEMQSLAGLAAILHKFTVEPSSKSTPDIKLDPSRNVVQGFIGGLPLKIKLREKKP